MVPGHSFTFLDLLACGLIDILTYLLTLLALATTSLLVLYFLISTYSLLCLCLLIRSGPTSGSGSVADKLKENGNARECGHEYGEEMNLVKDFRLQVDEKGKGPAKVEKSANTKDVLGWDRQRYLTT